MNIYDKVVSYSHIFSLLFIHIHSVIWGSLGVMLWGDDTGQSLKLQDKDHGPRNACDPQGRLRTVLVVRIVRNLIN